MILADRYATSNSIYQMEKIDESKWDEYLDWSADFEYNKIGIPKPDLVIFLDMPVEVSQRLMTARYDGDESKKTFTRLMLIFLINAENQHFIPLLSKAGRLYLVLTARNRFLLKKYIILFLIL